MNSCVSPQQAATEILRRRAARKSLLRFTEYTNAAYRAAPHHRLIAEMLEAVERGDIKRLMICMPPRHGKQVDDDCPVLTTGGWRRHGDLRRGDQVFGPDGQPAVVVGVSEPSFQDVEVEFTDGSTVLVHELHEWTVFDRGCKRFRTVETRDFERIKLWSGKRGKRGGRVRFQLPARKALKMPHADLPLDPYCFGAWLGDGRANAAQLCWAANDDAVAIAVNAAYPFTSRWTHKTTGVEYAVIGGFVGGLRQLGVLGAKRIPQQYLLASERQRLELLAGLIDTDGHVEQETQRVRIATGSDQLAADIEDLIRSLGWRACRYTQQPCVSTSGIVGRKEIHYISFTPDSGIPTKIERKRVTGNADAQRAIGIAGVKRVSPSIGRCIQVDREDGLYLVGREMVPTHNSELASRRFPAWYIGRNPQRQVIAASYNSELATDFGREVRNIVASQEFGALFPGTKLSADSQAANRWHTDAGGVYVAAGVGTAVTGRGADVLLIDDPFKDRAEADSEVTRRRVWDWFASTAYTRLMPDGAVVLINTRWHDDDLAGRILEQKSEQWTVLSLPALTDGVALWPEWYPADRLEQIRMTIGDREWSALYQQQPAPDEGDFFRRDWFGEFDADTRPQELNIYGASDYAVTADGGDYTEHGIVGVDAQNNWYVLDWWRGQSTSDVWIDRKCDLIVRHKPLRWFGESGVIRKAIEPYLVRRMEQRQAYCWVEWLPSISDKPTRARSFQALASMGKVRLPKSAPWKADLLTQLLRFPAGKHDDGVDVLSLMARGLQTISGAAPAYEREPQYAGNESWMN